MPPKKGAARKGRKAPAKKAAPQVESIVDAGEPEPVEAPVEEPVVEEPVVEKTEIETVPEEEVPVLVDVKPLTDEERMEIRKRRFGIPDTVEEVKKKRIKRFNVPEKVTPKDRMELRVERFKQSPVDPSEAEKRRIREERFKVK